MTIVTGVIPCAPMLAFGTDTLWRDFVVNAPRWLRTNYIYNPLIVGLYTCLVVKVAVSASLGILPLEVSNIALGGSLHQ